MLSSEKGDILPLYPFSSLYILITTRSVCILGVVSQEQYHVSTDLTSQIGYCSVSDSKWMSLCSQQARFPDVTYA